MPNPTSAATALKRKASNTIANANKKKNLTGDTSNSITSCPENRCNKSSSQATVINVDTDEGVENVPDDMDIESAEEDAQAELGMVTAVTLKHKLNRAHWSECLKNEWNAPIYAFFEPIPNIGYENGRQFHEFTCTAKACQKKVHCYLDKKDARLTSNLQKHAKSCWGMKAVKDGDHTKEVAEAHDSVLMMKDGSITEIFKRVTKGKVSYSHQQHTKTETK